MKRVILEEKPIDSIDWEEAKKEIYKQKGFIAFVDADIYVLSGHPHKWLYFDGESISESAIFDMKDSPIKDGRELYYFETRKEFLEWCLKVTEG